MLGPLTYTSENDRSTFDKMIDTTTLSVSSSSKEKIQSANKSRPQMKSKMSPQEPKQPGVETISRGQRRRDALAKMKKILAEEKEAKRIRQKRFHPGTRKVQRTFQAPVCCHR